jgi:peptidyl-dipeptidase Dcp
MTTQNPLLAPWSGPDGGVPPFDKVSLPHLENGLNEALERSRREIRDIADSAEAPTFDNTIVALEKSGETMDRIAPVYSVWSSAMRSPEFQELESKMALKLAAFRDEIMQNGKLFRRIEAVHASPDMASRTTEEKRLVWQRHTNFVLAGARLDEEQKKEVAAINQKLAALMTKFGQNTLADEEADYLVIENAAGLKGLGPDLIEAAANAAKGRGHSGKWVIANSRSFIEPFLSYADDRALREKAFRMFTSRGDRGNANDNNQNAAEILALRQKRSKIMGYPSFAHWKLAGEMAKEPQAAMDLMLKVWKPATEAVRRDVADMEKIAGHKIEPWDYRYYAEKVRKEKYDVDFEKVKPYMQLDKIRDAMFWMAGELYGYKFRRVTGVPVYHPDVSVFDVERHGKKCGLFYFDPYARSGKSSGAWMNSYREQKRLGGKEVLPIVSNNSNFVPGKPGEPVLVSWNDAFTMFHEFGHALHGLSSNVVYPYLAGTNVTGDFVELPSQMHEKFLETPAVMKFLTDNDGRPLPKELLEKMEASKTFNEGFATVEFLASAIVDMKLHLSAQPVTDMKAFEKETLSELGMPSEIVMRHRIPHFGHIFEGESYAAGYYGYLWAQVLDNDAFAAFTETGDPLNKAVAAKFFDNVLSIGNTRDPGEAYRAFRGRDATPDALLRARGFL